MNRWKSVVTGVVVIVVIAVVVLLAKEMLEPNVRSLNLRYLSGTEGASILTGQVPAGAIEGWADPRNGGGGGSVFIKGSDSDVEKAREILTKYDIPSPQVALKFQIIEADGFAQSDTSIAAVESVLRSLFRFKGYRLAAEAYLTARANTSAQQTIAGADGVQYSIDVGVGDVLRRGGTASVELDTKLFAGSNQALGTSVNVPDSQTVVLGTARPDAKRAALILVVTPEIK
jgi:hypothetical protein